MLVDLLSGRSQLLVDRFTSCHVMFGPSYTAGCPVNSSIAGALDGLPPHLHACDVTLVLVSPAPLAKRQNQQRRMGWNLSWVSSANSGFNRDLGAAATADQVRSLAPPPGATPERGCNRHRHPGCLRNSRR